MLVKVNRHYLVTELAERLRVHKNTVRNWDRKGLTPIDDRKPRMYSGADVREYLMRQRQQRKRKCPPSHLYCVRCREPKPPAEDMVDFAPSTPTYGNLRGFCPTCGTLMHLRASTATIPRIWGHLEVTLPKP
jgi:hypothetical protein